MSPVDVLRRKENVNTDASKTISGISSKFEYICKVSNVFIINIFQVTEKQVSGEGFWRRFPCFCEACIQQQWEECTEESVVGNLTRVNI